MSEGIQTGSRESVFAYVLALHSEAEYQQPKLRGAQASEKVAKRVPGGRFSHTSWRCTRSQNFRQRRTSTMTMKMATTTTTTTTSQMTRAASDPPRVVFIQICNGNPGWVGF